MTKAQHKPDSPLQSLWSKNPILVQLLGLSPLLAMSTSAIEATVLGVIAAIVCLASTFIHVNFHSNINPSWRFVWFLFITSSLTSLLSIFLQYKFLALHRELGIYLPLVACNFALLLHLEKVNDCLKGSDTRFSALTSVYYCLGLISAMLIFSSIRELIGYGSIFRDWELLSVTATAELENPSLADTDSLFPFSLSQPGAFILLGFFLAATNFLSSKYSRHADKEVSIPEKIPRARVTGKI